MRHVIGLLFGVVLAPVIWFLAALGHFRFLDALQRFGDNPDRLPTELAFGAVLIVAAGAWLGVLLSSRLSPLAPAVTGLAWLAMGAVFVSDVERVTNVLPNGPSGQEGLFALPLEHGYVFLVGTALLSPLFSPARWRGGAPRAATAIEATVDPEPQPESYRTGSHATVTAEPQRYARPARAIEETYGNTGEYRTHRGGPPARGPAAAVPEQQRSVQRLASWNEDSSAEEQAARHRTRDA
jgi:hypothetical protein